MHLPMNFGLGLRPLGLRSVTINDSFWAPRREVVRTRTIPQQEAMLSAPGQQFDALKMQWKPGEPNEPHVFWESDVAKWIEAASYVLETHPDPSLDKAVDVAIELLAKAQEPDGYLNVYYTLVKPGERFTDLRDAHELYCAGHLIEAAVAHHQATGKTSLLDVMTRYADLIDREFSPGGAAEGGYCGHQEIELALVKLYRATGTRRYLELSKRFIDSRGQKPFYFEVERERRGNEGYFGALFADRPERPEHYQEYNQSHEPVVEQADAVGHSVRAMYMFSAMTDLAAEYDDDPLFRACQQLWDSVTGKKMYLTGGVGSDATIEGFGPDYDLPDFDGYAETCAAIGLVMWSQRMALLTGEGKYVDVLERALYNGVLSGASSDGTCYFYGNPLASDGSVHRHEWFGVACCPPNFARLLSSLEKYVYAEGPHEAVVNLYVAGGATFHFDNADFSIRQETAYPWDGRVAVTVTNNATTTPVSVKLRIPAWTPAFTLRLNGELLENEVADGYVEVTRLWSTGDQLELNMTLEPRRVWADPRETAAAGKVALARGPLVYCIEGIDLDISIQQVTIPRNAPLKVEPAQDLDVDAIILSGIRETLSTDPLYRSQPPLNKPITLRFIPYFAWANRGQSAMSVWARETVHDLES